MTAEPKPYTPTGREQFWLAVATAFASGVGLGMGAATLLIRGVFGA